MSSGGGRTRRARAGVMLKRLYRDVASSCCRARVCMPLICGLFVLLQCACCMADEVCHYQFLELSPPIASVSMLGKVEYAYAMVHDEGCRLEVVPDARDGVECSRPQVDMRPVGGMTQVETHVSLNCQFRRPGFFYSAPVHFELVAPGNGQRQAVYVPMRELHVAFAASDARLEARLEFHVWENRLNIWLWLCAAVLMCGVAVWFGVRRRSRKGSVPEERMPDLAPLEEFWLEIRTLSAIDPTTTSERRAYHDRLSIALRRMIGRVFGMDCLSDTTRELFDRLKGMGLPPGVCMETRRILDRSDLIRFSGMTTGQEANLTMLRDACYVAASLDGLSRQQPAGEIVQDVDMLEDVVLDEAQKQHIEALLKPSSERSDGR